MFLVSDNCCLAADNFSLTSLLTLPEAISLSTKLLFNFTALGKAPMSFNTSLISSHLSPRIYYLQSDYFYTN